MKNRRSQALRLLGWSAAAILAILAIVVIAFSLWALNPPQPMAEALAALQSDDQVKVDTSRWIEFRPTSPTGTQTVSSGFIFYPGGRVDARAYAPALRQIAQAGYYAVIVPMPLNHAVLAPNRADAVIAAHPEIKQWAIGGHSLGGVMAASYVYGHPDCLQRLILWASYPTANNNLAIRSDLVATSIYATNDGLIPRSDIDDSKALLPPRTRFVAISGGNHAQFGWYGEQSGDAPASISRQEQQEEIVAATVELLR